MPHIAAAKQNDEKALASLDVEAVAELAGRVAGFESLDSKLVRPSVAVGVPRRRWREWWLRCVFARSGGERTDWFR